MVLVSERARTIVTLDDRERERERERAKKGEERVEGRKGREHILSKAIISLIKMACHL